MRALLVVNPTATATSARVRDVLIRALGSDLKLDVAETGHRGHAVVLAEQAALDGFGMVVALGGDGTVNEVINGVMRVPDPQSRPAVAVVPGGSANVLSRLLGQPADPVETTSVVLEALRTGRRRTISLGRAGDRYFTFCAGLGIDAEVVSLVEQRRAGGAVATPALYARAAVRHYFAGTDRRHARLRVELPGEPAVDGLAMAIVQSTAPWTYCGSRPLNPSPDAGFDTGLDLFALRRLRTFSTLRAVLQMASSNPAGPRGRQVVRRHDLAELTVAASAPLALQLDGDYCGERERVVLTSVPAALSLVV
ncbi:MAG: diacylglycerol/lipid kinase family protein [Frankiaceae bacterium]